MGYPLYPRSSDNLGSQSVGMYPKGVALQRSKLLGTLVA